MSHGNGRINTKKLVIFGCIAVLLCIIAVVAYRAVRGDSASSLRADGWVEQSDGSASAGASKADASGLVNAKALECLPRGHDNYRTNSTLAVDPTDSDVIYVGVEYKGVFKSTDAGASWKQSDFGIRGYPKEGNSKEKCIQELGRTVFDPKDNKHILMSRVESPGTLDILFSENAGLWESKDAGATWKQLVKDKMNASGSRAVAFDPSDPKVMYYGVNNMLPSFGGTGGVGSGNGYTDYFNKTGILYKTTDGGASWTELPTGADKGFRAITTFVDAQNAQNIWLFAFTNNPETRQFEDAAQPGPMRSTDGGKTWSKQAAAFPAGYKVLVGGEANPADNLNAFAPTQNTTGAQKSFVTTDGGGTWKQSNVYQYVVAYDPADASGKRLLGYNPYEAGGGIYQSLDKGLTWSKFSSVPPEVNNSDRLGVRIEGFAFSRSQPGTVYMSGSAANVWKSVDNGRSWKNVMNLTTVGGQNKNSEGSTKSREQEPGV